jgi:hypothetical protein
VAPRLLYLIFIWPLGWLVLLGRSSRSKTSKSWYCVTSLQSYAGSTLLTDSHLKI